MSRTGKTALITGGLGFLGSHLAEFLCKNDFRVIVVDNLVTGDPKNEDVLKRLGSRIQVIKADVTETWAAWRPQIDEDWLKSLRYVFHFASPASPEFFDKLNLEIMRANSIGLENALDFATLAKAKVIFASTSEIYGSSRETPFVETNWGTTNSYGPRSCYDESKRYGEALIFSFNQRKGTRHGLVRIFNTYGPRMNPNDGRVVINLMVQALTGNVLTVFGDGSQTRSFCYVDDLIEGIYKYAAEDLIEPLNIGHSEEKTILELAGLVQKIFEGQKLEIVFRELPKDDPVRRRPDISKALQRLHPWKPVISLETGLQRTKEWLHSRLTTSDFGGRL